MHILLSNRASPRFFLFYRQSNSPCSADVERPDSDLQRMIFFLWRVRVREGGGKEREEEEGEAELD